MNEIPETPGNVQALLRRIWAAIVKYRGMVAAMVLFGVLEAVLTKAPFVVIKPLLAEMAKGKDGAAAATTPSEDEFNARFGEFAAWLCDLLGLSFDKSGMQVVVACAVVTVICGLLGSVTIYLVATITRFFAYGIVADLRCELARHFLSLPLRFFGQQRMGEMISRVTNNTQVMQRSFEMATDNVILDPLMILSNIGILVWFVPEATIVLLIMVPLIALPMYRQGRKVQKRSSKSLQAMGETTESLNQILTGIRTVKAFQLEAERLRDFERTTETFLERTGRVLRAKGLSVAQSFVGYQVGSAALVVVLGYVVFMRENGPGLDDIAVIIAPLATTYQHVKRLTRTYNVLRESAGALAGIEAILAIAPDPASVGGRPLGKVHGDVELRDVEFSYGDGAVLRGVSFSARAGQTVAIVGPTGSGKSTTMDLLLRFYDPTQGTILIDGVDLKELKLADYRRFTAVVSQDPFLFNTTLRENIACGKPGATQAEIEAAARAANIHDFIATLPNGYDTQAGERGSNLSGGQMQRVTIARAILRDPAILFLDEATSALDSESEQLVQRAFSQLRKGRTSFVIAHRLSTIFDADLIVVLEDGRIAEQGTHTELMALGGLYRRMVDKQTARSESA